MSLLVFGRTGQVATELARLVPDAVFLGRDAADLSDPIGDVETDRGDRRRQTRQVVHLGKGAAGSNDSRTLLGEQERDGTAHPLAGPRHECSPPFEPSAHSRSSLPRAPARCHMSTLYISTSARKGGERRRIAGRSQVLVKQRVRRSRSGAGIRFDAMGDIRNTLAPAESTGLRGRHDA